MLWWIWGHTRKEKRQNDYIWEGLVWQQLRKRWQKTDYGVLDVYKEGSARYQWEKYIYGF